MLAIGRGLMAEPELLILDEPSLGLSPLLVEEMFGLVRQLNRDGLSILLVEQNVVQSLAIAHRAFVLEHGVIAMAGAHAERMKTPGHMASYLGLWSWPGTSPSPLRHNRAAVLPGRHVLAPGRLGVYG